MILKNVIIMFNLCITPATQYELKSSLYWNNGELLVSWSGGFWFSGILCYTV